jgi:hypothetical protein
MSAARNLLGLLHVMFVLPLRLLLCLSRTFSVVAERHLCLAKADGVFTLANAIELFQLSLIDALQDTRVSLLLSVSQ